MPSAGVRGEHLCLPWPILPWKVSMTNLLAVAAGGALGAVLRYLVVSAASAPGWSFPYGTLIVNVAGSLALGLLAGYWVAAGQPVPSVRLFFQTGMLGAFTTFSAFSLDTMILWQNGQALPALANALLNVLLCLMAVGSGLVIGATLHR